MIVQACRGPIYIAAPAPQHPSTCPTGTAIFCDGRLLLMPIASQKCLMTLWACSSLLCALPSSPTDQQAGSVSTVSGTNLLERTGRHKKGKVRNTQTIHPTKFYFILICGEVYDVLRSQPLFASLFDLWSKRVVLHFEL